MKYIILLFRSILLAVMAQTVLINAAPAAESSARHQLLLLYSANVLGEMEPCGG